MGGTTVGSGVRPGRQRGLLSRFLSPEARRGTEADRGGEEDGDRDAEPHASRVGRAAPEGEPSNG